MHSFLFQLKKRRTISGTRFLSHPASAQASPSTTDTRWLPETTSSLLFSYKEKWIHKLLPPPVMSKDGKAQDTSLLGWPTPQDTHASLSLRALGFPALSRVIRATRTIELILFGLFIEFVSIILLRIISTVLIVQNVGPHENNGSYIHIEVVERRIWSQTSWVQTPPLLPNTWVRF